MAAAVLYCSSPYTLVHHSWSRTQVVEAVFYHSPSRTQVAEVAAAYRNSMYKLRCPSVLEFALVPVAVLVPAAAMSAS